MPHINAHACQLHHYVTVCHEFKKTTDRLVIGGRSASWTDITGWISQVQEVWEMNRHCLLDGELVIVRVSVGGSLSLSKQ